MARRKTSKRSKARTMLRLADLEQSKNAVLHSLGAASSQESNGHAIDEFIGWYCSEPRLAFNRTVVLRYRFFLEQKNLAPSSGIAGINPNQRCVATQCIDPLGQQGFFPLPDDWSDVLDVRAGRQRIRFRRTEDQRKIPRQEINATLNGYASVFRCNY